MSLKPLRQEIQYDLSWITPWTQEMGGLLTFHTASGTTFVQYSHEASGVIPVGIQINDVEHVDYTREVPPQVLRRSSVVCDVVGICNRGEFITDWIHLIGSVLPGDAMYVGPSGTFTNSATFGGSRVGKFIGTLKSDAHVVTMRGLGSSRQYIDPCDLNLYYENNPAHRTLVVTPGYIKVKIEL